MAVFGEFLPIIGLRVCGGDWVDFGLSNPTGISDVASGPLDSGHI
jgi:hypothetical protein